MGRRPPQRSRLFARSDDKSSQLGYELYTNRALASLRFSTASPRERLHILHHAMSKTAGPCDVLSWLGQDMRLPSRVPPMPSIRKVYSPRQIESSELLTAAEATYIFSACVPFSFANAVGRNFHWRRWMTRCFTNWSIPAILRFIVCTAVRFAYLTTDAQTCAGQHLVGYLTAVLSVQSCIAPEWISSQIPFLCGYHVKRSVEVQEWRPFFHRLGISFLRMGTEISHKGGFCGECASFSMNRQHGGWLNPSSLANVLVQCPPPQFLPMLTLFEQRFHTPITERTVQAYLTCWALTEKDFSSFVFGCHCEISSEEMILHAHQIYLLYKNSLAFSQMSLHYSVSLYSLLVQVCYCLGDIGGAWKISKQAQLHSQLPSHALYVLLDLRNHLPDAETFIPDNEYLPFLQLVVDRYTSERETSHLSPPEVRLFIKLGQELAKNIHALRGSDDIRLIIHTLRHRLRTDDPEEMTEEVTASLADSMIKLLKASSCFDVFFPQLSAALQSTYSAALPAAVMMEAALCAGHVQHALDIYCALKQPVQTAIFKKVKVEILDSIYLALCSARRHAEAKVLKPILQLRRQEKTPSAEIEKISEKVTDHPPYYVSIDFERAQSIKDTEDGKQIYDTFRLLYW
ncbi:hypothetical protein XU18_2013 [Perkinsela sp. CCAP 1560/4]|nr:hypothetical protein XU18_2013 [Perkinsela sp. CCAP 1560/4]|eukprot:KNH07481.1 hypothetical protein XU18_2013 [Perkinsela sp. CCAP 1560/4]